ncbi:MAG: hypothetical protein H6822_08975 [Planctomycetaceae bacterium]|nr:hypothetical protein [Planctomycetaceae bacterium]
MLHDSRLWKRTTGPTPAKLAEILTREIHPLCAGFAIRGYPEYLFLNDSISSHGAQEYGFLKRSTFNLYRQYESITFGWCSTAEAEAIIEECLSGRFDGFNEWGAVDAFQVESPAVHRKHRHRYCSCFVPVYPSQS